ncbi:MAG: hypothetical protein ACXWB9_01705 [Flavisolibacter sp.]
MKNKFLLSILSLFLASGLVAQSGNRIGSHESIGAWNPSGTRTSFSNVTESRNIAQEIIDIVGLKPNFEVREANVPNAAAIVYNGKRYVLYNPTFIRQLEKSTGTKWAGISVLAHEIGHHLNGHTITASGSQPSLELESDEFSGFVLRKMGATLSQSQAAMKTLASVNASKTHPGQYDRLTAIANGWEKADAQLAGRKFEPRQANPRQPVVTRKPAPTQRQNTAMIRNNQVLGDVRFNADATGRYYITTGYNLVKMVNNQLHVIGKLSQLNNRNYPYMIADQSTQLLVDRYGTILTRQGRTVGKLTART